MSNRYQTPENHRAGKPPLHGALYYGTIRRSGQTYHIALFRKRTTMAIGLIIPLISAPTPPPRADIAMSDEIEQRLAAGAVVAFSVSGGKDSNAMVLATEAELRRRGHADPRVLIHAHLGPIEHRDALPSCERLAALIGLELIVVDAPGGGMIARWQRRWRDNVRRYVELRCVKLIMPWSSAALRFCTAEMKLAPIARTLQARFPGQTIVSVVGIRRAESARRAQAPVAKADKRLINQARQTTGVTWHPILHWTEKQVWAIHDMHGLIRPEPYRVWGLHRLSCSFCILSSLHDLRASARCPHNHAAFRELVALEIESAFSFQPGRWLADAAPHLLDDTQRELVEQAKAKAARRAAAEARIPKAPLYHEGWPTAIPTAAEARLLSEVRHEVAEIMRLPLQYLAPDAIIARYEELIEEKRRKEERKRPKWTKPTIIATPVQMTLW
jgi:Phosphoadenosine phosphosulfate reductase family